MSAEGRDHAISFLPPPWAICFRNTDLQTTEKNRIFQLSEAHSFLFDNWAFWPNEMKSSHSELNQQPWKVMATLNGQLRSSGIGICFKGGLDRRHYCSKLRLRGGSAPISS
ncbi:hypothetical protein TNCT_92421 [Trichonephila clavata]|uniref:Uncharacterized protein n=1 Tax=Trichonephila clavata TaxID=2740835 RepID=A0A8X6H1A3_TRICU|nr:hypothetical protein TNCT_92421 [Trichonephila clavata]